MRTARLVTLAVAGTVMAFASGAYAQNPFAIDGIVTDDSNSGVPSGPSQPGDEALVTSDPNSNARELGPRGGSATKLGAIHEVLTPPTAVLSLGRQNASVDLSRIYTQTAKALNGDLWFYFGWVLDAPSANGVISIEFQQSERPGACDYSSPVDTSALIADCNPWANRQANDFLIVWDTKGSSTILVKRTFTLASGRIVLQDCPRGWPGDAGVPDTEACTRLSSSAAIFGAGDATRGEAAINLTTDLFPQGACVTFSNVIPGTTTSGSSSALYRDVVLSDLPDVANCGTLVVRKVTEPAEQSGPFAYTLERVTSGQLIAFPDISSLFATIEGDGASNSHAPLIPADGDYKLTEDVLAPPWQHLSTVCRLLHGSGPEDDESAGSSTAFTVLPGETTECTITNRLVP